MGQPSQLAEGDRSPLLDPAQQVERRLGHEDA